MRERVEAANRSLARAVGDGVVLDAVHDIPRILRPVGTLNHKYGAPRLVEAVRLERERVYTLDDVEDWLRRHSPQKHTPQTPRVSQDSTGAARGGASSYALEEAEAWPARHYPLPKRRPRIEAAATASPDPAQLAAVPPWLIRWAKTGAQAGTRNCEAFTLACRLRQYVADAPAGRRVLDDFAANCRPPLDEREVDRIWASAGKTQPYTGPWQPLEPVKIRDLSAGSRPCQNPYKGIYKSL
jgi:hypothetical protein